MRAPALNRLPQEWLGFVAAWGLGLAELPAALPASAAVTVPARTASQPPLRTSGAHG